tara:strand:+ start:323 stop:511 length:189 start_codon:yes stop_codon:yes gene_type:complete
MIKEIILAVGSSSWWKSKKLRKESADKLKVLRKDWKYLRKEVLLLNKEIIDTKKYKKYFFYK